MKIRSRPFWILVLPVVLIQAIWLFPEVSIGRFDLNDGVLHYTLADRLVQTIERGENPLDFWLPEFTLGHPITRTYQTLSHWLVAAAYFAFGRSISVLTLFVWIRYLMLVAIPLTAYFSGRLLGLNALAAAGAAAVSPFLSTNNLFGIEYGSYLWRGNGLLPQLLAQHLLMLSIGVGYRAMNSRHRVLAGLLIGLTFQAHFIYGYMAALTVALLLFVPFHGTTFQLRFIRLFQIGTVAFAVSAYALIPLLTDAWLVNHSRWEAVWKWQSFGAGEVLRLLFTGGLLDYGRLPILTVLAAAGLLACIVPGFHRRGATDAVPAPLSRFLVAGLVVWLALFFGRPAWGDLLNLLGLGQDVHLHRLVGGVQVFLIFLCGAGFSALCSRIPQGTAWSGVAALIVLMPVMIERHRFTEQNTDWGRENERAFADESSEINSVLAEVRSREGRAYAGLGANWGKDFRIGSVPVYALFGGAHIPAVSYLYHAMALSSDVMVHFDENRADHHRVFNVTSVVAPQNSVPAGLQKLSAHGRFQVFAGSGQGYFEAVSVPYSVHADKGTFYDWSSQWLQSDWPAQRQHLLIDFKGDAPAAIPRLQAGTGLSPVAASEAGVVVNESRAGETYQARIRMNAASFVLFKMNYHPGWQATVDGRAVQTVMLTPGFTGIPIGPGEHDVSVRYVPSATKTLLFIIGLAFLCTVASLSSSNAIKKT